MVVTLIPGFQGFRVFSFHMGGNQLPSGSGGAKTHVCQILPSTVLLSPNTVPYIRKNIVCSIFFSPLSIRHPCATSFDSAEIVLKRDF